MLVNYIQDQERSFSIDMTVHETLTIIKEYSKYTYIILTRFATYYGV